MNRIFLGVILSLVSVVAAAAEPARVLVVGTYHFSNPGNDLHNVEAVDITTPERQAQLQVVSDGLARFEPTLVAVEWPAGVVDDRYAKYLDGSLPPSTNEVVQLGFRLASQRGLDKVHGIDVPGDFPYEAVMAWAQANGRQDDLQAVMTQVQSIVEGMTAAQATQGIGGVLRGMNTPEAINESHGFYAEMLRFGAGDEQPGVALNAAWAERNLAICARLLQALQPGDRAVVFYGHGHAYLLNRCLAETPGVELVQANDYLVE